MGDLSDDVHMSTNHIFQQLKLKLVCSCAVPARATDTTSLLKLTSRRNHAPCPARKDKTPTRYGPLAMSLCADRLTLLVGNRESFLQFLGKIATTCIRVHSVHLNY
jgi:hypothetical protein